MKAMVNFSRFPRFFTTAKDLKVRIYGHCLLPSSGTVTDWIEFVELMFIPDLSPRTCDYLARIWVDVIFGQNSVVAILAVHPPNRDLRT